MALTCKAVVRQVGFGDIKKIVKRTTWYCRSAASLFTLTHSNNTLSYFRKSLSHYNYQIVFREVKPAEITTSRTTDSEDAMSNTTEHRASPLPKATSPSGTRFRKPSGIISPPVRKGMLELDKAAFEKDIKIPVVYVYEDRLNPQTLQTFKKFMLKIQGLKPVMEVEESIKSPSTETPDSCDNQSSSMRKLKKIFINPELIKGFDATHFVQHEIQPDPSIVSSVGYETVKFTYENWNLNQIINSILPDDEDKVSGFSQIGHIIHLNLRDHVLPFKTLIGQVFLDKISNAKTVVNKVNVIESKFRNFQMELLAGDPNTIVTVKENRCEFEFDFATVYWNPRLSSEHDRLVKSIEPNDVLYDVFAGVGPFTIPAAKKKITVLANDLNPDSFKWLQHNVKKNKVASFVHCFNLDGRAFIQNIASADLSKRLNCDNCKDGVPSQQRRFHFVMNLPALAVDFLDAFWGALNKIHDSTLFNKITVVVHVYCFIKDVEGFKEKAVNLVNERLGYDLPKGNLVEVVFVRNVAPNKEMLRVSFSLPLDVMLGIGDKRMPLKRKFCDTEETSENAS